MDPIQTYYRDLSKRYNKQRSNPYFKLIEDIELNILKEYLSTSAQRVLEVGCGTGIFLKHLSKLDHDLHGLDYTEGMLRVAQMQLSNNDNSATLLHGNAENLPYSDNSFDLVYSYKVLAHVPNLHSALNDIHRVLQPNGTAILEFYNKFSLRRLFHRSEYYHNWLSPKEVRQSVNDANFTITKIYGARICIPTASFMQINGLKQIFRFLETKLSATPLNFFAGYYIVICKPKP